MDPGGISLTKVVSLDQLLELRAELRAVGRSLVHCHGCFDIVHPGHVRHLQYAATQGDHLLVSITADQLVDKGDNRPLFSQNLRAESLAALECVDWVYVNPDPTAESLLQHVQPDVYVKGREYEENADPRFEAERRAVESGGGRVLFSSGDVVFSSTALIDSLERGADADRSADDPARRQVKRLIDAHDLSLRNLSLCLERMRGKRVAVIGETIIDTYVHCAWPDVAGESPVMSLRPISRSAFDGAAAVLSRHLAAFGAVPTLITPLPESAEADLLTERLATEGVEVIPIHHEGPIPEKQRFLVGGEKVFKLDMVRPIALDSRNRDALQQQAADAARDADAAILADFGLGMLSSRVLGDLVKAIRPHVDILAGDVSGRRASLLSMRDADWLSPSEAELRDALGDYDSSLPAVVWKLMGRTGAENVLVTLGPDGLVAFRKTPDAHRKDGWPSRTISEHLPALAPPRVVDPLGCGDALLAVGVLALSAGADLMTSAYLGALAAASEASFIGNLPVSPAEILSRARRVDEAQLVAHIRPQALRLAGHR